MSLRSGHVTPLGVCLLCAITGCGHLLESRAITDFTYALQEQDLEYLRESTSSEFGQSALRRTEALEDLKILRLPQEPPSIVKVVDVSATEKQVTVTNDPDSKSSKQSQLLYKLTRSDDQSDWVVDDIYIKRKQKGLKVTKSVTEQMDLLLTLRDFLDAWETGGREEILQVSTPRLSRELAGLPPAYLLHLTRRIVPDSKKSTRHRPEAQLDKNVAIVSLPRPDGKLIIAFRLIDQHWRVDDIAFDPQRTDQAVTSVLKMAAVMNAALDFLNTYQSGDKQALKKHTSRKFFQRTLLPANLSEIQLPAPDDSPQGFQVTTYGQRATFLTSLGQQMFSIDLITAEQADPANSEEQSENDDQNTVLTAQAAEQPQFVVEEVTLYENGSNQRKRMSAMFTARQRVRLFVEAVSRRNLPMIRSIVTPEFNERVWQRLDDNLMTLLPLKQLQHTDLKIEEIAFRGNYTEINGYLGQNPIAFRLRDWNGDLGIDDVSMPVADQPESLRKRLEIIIPITEFALGIHNRDVSRLQQHSSADFNRLVWSQVRTIPQIGFPVVQHMRAPLTSIELSEQQARVRLGDERWGALVSMVIERGYWVVDEVQLIAGPEARRRTQMKHTIRVQLANGLLSSTTAVPRPEPARINANIVPSQTRPIVEPQPNPRPVPATTTNVGLSDDSMPPIPLPFRRSPK